MSINTIRRKESSSQAQSSCQTLVEGSVCGSLCACQTVPHSTHISLAHTSPNQSSRWRQIRAGVMFGVACIASPCCTPLIVPVILSLLAGSPLALWIGPRIGWVYGGLTLISVASLIMALRWSRKPSAS